jgi:hypothetical protein
MLNGPGMPLIRNGRKNTRNALSTFLLHINGNSINSFVYNPRWKRGKEFSTPTIMHIQKIAFNWDHKGL